MKKLNTNTKTKIHVAAHLSLLPPEILTLAVALSPQDREVLAYLISCCSANSASTGHRGSSPVRGKSGGEHAPLFDCDCFRCYMSYWVRWDTSPNREVIHEIIDAYEDGGQCIGTGDQKGSYKLKGKSGRKKRSKGSFGNNRGKENEVSNVVNSSEIEEGGELEKGSVGKLVNFLGERIWGVWDTLLSQYRSDFPSSIKELVVFVDLAPRFQLMAKKKILRRQVELVIHNLKEAMDRADGFQNTHQIKQFESAKFSVDQVVFILENVHIIWESLLLPSTYRGCMSIVLEAVFSRTTKDILLLDDMAAEETLQVTDFIKAIYTDSPLRKECLWRIQINDFEKF